MAEKRANVELQYGPGGFSLVVSNDDGYAALVSIDSDERESLVNVFGEEIKEEE